MIGRLMKTPAGLAFLILGLIIVAMSTVSFVPETRQGVVVQFGQPVRIINGYDGKGVGYSGAGLYVRIPFAEQVEWIDKRVLSLDMEEQEVTATNQSRLKIDAYARYRIVDPLRMYMAARNEERLKDALQPLLTSSVRNELGKQTFEALLSPERGNVMQNIKVGMNTLANQYGVEVVDVRIVRAELPTGTPLEAAFARMRTARKLQAETIRAEGWKNAQLVRATADAEASRVYAQSFGKDPNFYSFYRAMQSYRTTFIEPDPKNPRSQTSMVLAPGNEYLREFRGQ